MREDMKNEMPQRPYPDLLSEDEKKEILKIAEYLWEDLQKNNLGGFSGINRPFHILNMFMEVIEKFGKRDVGLTWSKNDLDSYKAPENSGMPEEIWAATYYGKVDPKKGQNYGEWADYPDASIHPETRYIRFDKLEPIREALEFYADDEIYIDDYGYGRSMASRARKALKILNSLK